MNKKEFQQLAEKISKGVASQKDVALYNYYYDKFQQNGEWDKSLLDEKDDIEKELHARITKNLVDYPSRVKSFPYFKVAAAVVLFTISVGLLVWNKRQSIPSLDSVSERFVQDIDPGTHRAVLTLGDGTLLNLEGSNNGILTSQGNSQILKLADGQLAYTAIEGQTSLVKDVFNTITVPRSGQYQLTLPDGTKVWLNSASSLKFPASFASSARVVELEGEAYFEVTTLYDDVRKEKRPFIVKTPTQRIDVLGTRFNVNAYKGEKTVKTTLIEGSVSIASAVTGQAMVLKPGQQSQLSNSGTIHLTDNMDAEEAIAWKNGIFHFHNTDLSTIMRELSRWYNVDIDIENIPQRKFNGVLSRNVQLSQVLQMMEKTSGLKFNVEERKISMSK